MADLNMNELFKSFWLIAKLLIYKFGSHSILGYLNYYVRT